MRTINSIQALCCMLFLFSPEILNAQHPVRVDADSICLTALNLPLEEGIGLITGSFEKCRGSEQESKCMLKMNFTAGYLYQVSSSQSMGDHRASLEKSLVYYQRAHEIDSADVSVLKNMFLVNQALGNNRAALDILDKALKIDQKNRTKYLINEGDIYFELEDFKKAIKSYNLAFFANPNNEALGWKIIYSLALLPNMQEAYKGLISFGNSVFDLGLNDLARNGFLTAVKISLSINDNEKAEQACIRWAETLSRKNNINANYIDELPDLTSWPSDCNQELQLLLSNSFQSTKRLSWWTKDAYRSHIIAALMLKIEASALVDGEIIKAVQILENGLEIAPELYAYYDPKLKIYFPVKMDIAIELSRLYNRYPEMDLDKSRCDALIWELFDEKMTYYLRLDLESIQRSHTMLGLIYADRGVWTSGWYAGNAIFQLEHAIEFQKRLEADHPEKFKPIPSIYQMLAKGYEKTNRQEEELQNLVDAAAGYLDLDNLSMVDSIIQKVKNAPLKDTKYKQKLKELEMINHMRLNIRYERYDFKSVDIKSIERNITESDLFRLTDLINDRSFMNRQKFKILADMGSKCSQLNPAYKYPYFEIKALDYIDKEKALGNYQDINRLNQIEGKFIKNLDPETEIKVNQNINMIDEGNRYKTWSVNSGEYQTQIQVNSDLIVAGRVFEDLGKGKSDNEVEGLDQIQIRQGDILIPKDLKESKLIDESKILRVKGVNNVRIINEVPGN